MRVYFESQVKGEGTGVGESFFSAAGESQLLVYFSDARISRVHLRILGSIRPYLVAACKWYSEADAGPGAEAGAGFRD